MNNRSIVYYAGSERADEEWTPESIKTGIGGSETAVIYLAKHWVELGYTVTVYCNCGEREGNYDGVKYLNSAQFDQTDTFDILILWRDPVMLDTPFQANHIWLDLQDIPEPVDYTQNRVENVDKIFAKSQYQRGLLPHIPDDKFVILSNGVDKRLLEWSNCEKDPYKLIYASGYGRGLEPMLMYGWQIIRQAIPDAQLHIYYGWDSYDISFGNHPQYSMWKQKMIELMSQPGITEHGRVGQEELIREKSTSAIHYYAATLAEIDCISVRESAMVGCVPVTTNYAAFKEKDYCVKVSGIPSDSATQEAIANKVVELLKHPQQLEEIRQTSKELVRSSTWDTIAQLWIKELSTRQKLVKGEQERVS